MMSETERNSFVAYAVQRFPALRTTFIRREVEALRQLGVRLEIFSMRPVAGAEVRSEGEALSHLRSTRYLPKNPISMESIVANLGAFGADPRTFVGNWQLLFQDLAGQGRLRTALQIWRGAVLAREVRRLGTCARVHAQFADGAATTALVAARLLGVPFSFSSHTSFNSALMKEKVRQADFIASISEYDRRQLIDATERTSSLRVHIIRCGIPLTAWPFAPRKRGKKQERLVSVGALIEKKGHDILIEACSFLGREGVEVRCDIIGEGPLRNELQNKIDNRGLGASIRLLGGLPQAEVKQAVFSADLFVLACRESVVGDTDGLPVALMEAMAAGCPVVSTAIAAIPELVVDEVTGFLAAPGDAESLAAKIRQALEMEPERRVDVVTLARKRVEKDFDQITEATKLAKLLRKEASASSQASWERVRS